MLKRSVVLFSLGVAALLFGVAQTDAQPGKGAKGGADIKKLEDDLAQLMDKVKDTKAKLDKAREGGDQKKDFGKQGFEGKGFGGFGRGGFGPGGFGKGKGGFGGFGGKGFEGKKGSEKLDPETVKERYEYYKKLYDELPKEKSKGDGKKGPPFEGKKGFPFEGKKGFGGGPGGGGSVEARIDRLIRELEQLRSELNAKKPGKEE
jgi:hypothetical protein